MFLNDVSAKTTIEPGQPGRKRKRKTAKVGFEIESSGGRHEKGGAIEVEKNEKKSQKKTKETERNARKSHPQTTRQHGLALAAVPRGGGKLYIHRRGLFTVPC